MVHDMKFKLVQYTNIPTFCTWHKFVCIHASIKKLIHSIHPCTGHFSGESATRYANSFNFNCQAWGRLHLQSDCICSGCGNIILFKNIPSFPFLGYPPPVFQRHIIDGNCNLNSSTKRFEQVTKMNAIQWINFIKGGSLY